MKTKINLISTTPEEIKQWLEFFGPKVLELSIEDRGFTSLIPYRRMSKEYVEILGLTKDTYKEYSTIIEDFNVWDNSNYFNCEFAKGTEEVSEETMWFWNSLNRAKGEFLDYMDANLSGRPHHLLLIRQVSPPLNHSNTDIVATGRDFGLLFEG